MVEQNLKEVVKAMCAAFPGGRSAIAGALGMSKTEFDNNLYEKNGCRFFEVSELEAIEDLSGTCLLADYFSARKGRISVKVQSRDDLDHVELFALGTLVAAKRGQVDLTIQDSIANDGVIDAREAAEILTLHNRHVAAREEYVRAVIALHREN